MASESRLREDTLQNLKTCMKVLRVFLDEVEQYIEGLVLETEAVSMLEDSSRS